MGHYHSAALIRVNLFQHSAPLRRLTLAADSNAGVKTVDVVRRLRLKDLQVEFLSLVAINGRLGLSARDSNLSQIVAGSIGSKTGRPKTMGSDLARRLELVCDKPVGWMDTDPAFDRLIGESSPEVVELAAMFRGIADPTERERLRIIVKHYSALAEAGELGATLDAQQRALPPAAPIDGPLPGSRSQIGLGRAARNS